MSHYYLDETIKFTKNLEIGVPDSYTSVSSNGVVNFLTKGQLNKVKVRPSILNEHSESSREAMDVVESGVIVGQMFKASQDNINGIGLTLESAAGSSLDDFESYADSAALQVVWSETDADDKALLETTIVKSGSKSMNVPLSATRTDEWQDSVGPTDYTGYTFSLDYQQNKTFSQAKLYFYIGDGTNTKSFALTVVASDAWQSFDIDEEAMSVEADDDTASAPSMAAITEIGFRLVDSQNNGQGYIDNLVATPEPGSVQIKLWDCGISLPTADGASFDLTNNATQYDELGDRGINGTGVAAEINLNLVGGKRLYEIKDFVAGVATEIPSNTTLTVGNYYALTIHYVDTDVNVYGPDTTFSTNYYTNGYGFFTTAENVDITTIPGAAGSGAYSDLMFLIYSTQNIYITGFTQFIVTSTGTGATVGGNASVNIFAEDSDMAVSGIISHGVGARAAAEFPSATEIRPMLLEKGGKFELYYSDDFTDDAAIVAFTMGYLYEPPTVNG